MICDGSEFPLGLRGTKGETSLAGGVARYGGSHILEPIKGQYRHHHQDRGDDADNALGTDLDTPDVDVESRFRHGTALH